MLLHILLCKACLLIDELIFRNYKKQKLNKSLFIIGVPRSGTSFLLNLIANDQSNFTAFRLWELVFAPSIIQKKTLISISTGIDKLGFNIKPLIDRLNEFLFSKMKGIHDMDLNGIEEDELVYMYLYKSAYLMFLFPELEELHELLIPDNANNLKDRIHQQQFYKSLVKRHSYVFNKEGEKYFISKNPIHSIRMDSLSTVFPNADYLFIHRELKKTIPSSISLNLNLYRFFCSVSDENPLRLKTIKMLIDWDNYIKQYTLENDWQPFEVDFKKMVKSPSTIAKAVHTALNLELDSEYEKFLFEQDEFSKNYKSKHQYPVLTDEELKLLL